MKSDSARAHNGARAQPDQGSHSSRIDSAALAVIVVRDGRLPAGTEEAAAQADGSVLLVGSGVAEAVSRLSNARTVWLVSSQTSPGSLCSAIAPLLGAVSVVVLPASPDGRDLAPVLSRKLGWPLLPGSVAASYHIEDGTVRVELLRADGRVVVPASTPAPAVVTVWPRARAAKHQDHSCVPDVYDLDRHPALSAHGETPVLADGETPVSADGETPVLADGETPVLADDSQVADLETLKVLAPEPSTMDLADAKRVLAGGAGLVARMAGDPEARTAFELLFAVASALGAAAGATRVITDAGWVGHDRQIGTTGVSIDPDLYVAFGISGASQHIGGIGDADHVVSINVDSSAPMARMANLAIVADAPAVLAEVARRLAVEIPQRPGGTS